MAGLHSRAAAVNFPTTVCRRAHSRSLSRRPGRPRSSRAESSTRRPGAHRRSPAGEASGR
eukprot:7323979-Alexandrium_andersonii.AAC.1